MSNFWAKPWEYFRGFVAAIAEPSAFMSAWMMGRGNVFPQFLLRRLPVYMNELCVCVCHCVGIFLRFRCGHCRMMLWYCGNISAISLRLLPYYVSELWLWVVWEYFRD